MSYEGPISFTQYVYRSGPFLSEWRHFHHYEVSLLTEDLAFPLIEKRWLNLAKPFFISHTPQGCGFENINILQFFELFSVLMSLDNILEIFILLTVYGLIYHLLTITVFSFHTLQGSEAKDILLFHLQSSFYKSRLEFA